MKCHGLDVHDCDCGASDAGHSPDCAFVRSSDEAQRRYREESDEVARKFCEIVRGWLTPEQLQKAVALNAAESNPGVCHLHDFCDANVAMDDALDSIGVGEDTGHPYRGALWEAAWRKAKKANFGL